MQGARPAKDLLVLLNFGDSPILAITDAAAEVTSEQMSVKFPFGDFFHGLDPGASGELIVPKNLLKGLYLLKLTILRFLRPPRFFRMRKLQFLFCWETGLR